MWTYEIKKNLHYVLRVVQPRECIFHDAYKNMWFAKQHRQFHYAIKDKYTIEKKYPKK